MSCLIKTTGKRNFLGIEFAGDNWFPMSIMSVMVTTVFQLLLLTLHAVAHNHHI